MQLYFNKVTFILPKLFKHFKYYWTVPQIEKKKMFTIVLRHSFETSPMWKISPPFLGDEGAALGE